MLSHFVDLQLHKGQTVNFDKVMLVYHTVQWNKSLTEYPNSEVQQAHSVLGFVGGGGCRLPQ